MPSLRNPIDEFRSGLLSTWFIPRDGILWDVIYADIQHYLGPDASIRSGRAIKELSKQLGDWVTIYRVPTAQENLELEADGLETDGVRWALELSNMQGGKMSAIIGTERTPVHLGYWITSDRTLNFREIQQLRAHSILWASERSKMPRGNIPGKEFLAMFA